MTLDDFEKALAWNQSRFDAGEITMEQITMMTYAYQLSRDDLEDDAWCGNITCGTLDNLYTEHFEENTPPEGWEFYDGPEEKQPTNRKTVDSMFGNPGKYSASTAWKRANIMACHKNNGNRLPGVPTRWWVSINKRVEPYLREGLRRAQVSAPGYKIDRIGGHNWRPIRHKAGNPLSFHSYGIAVDVDPNRNRAITFKKGKAPKAWSDEWMKYWPNGVTKEFVDAMASCGFAWGSDWDEDGLTHDHTWQDPMHFEWVARDGNSIEV